MAEKQKKKRIILRVLLIMLILLLIVIAVPIITLYVQYRNISYAPSVPVERPDEYVIPEYPELIFESEGGNTDDPPPFESMAETSAGIDTDVIETKAPESEAVGVEPETEAAESETDAVEAETEAPAFTVPETLPSIVYTPPETDPPAAQTTTVPQPKPPILNPNNSFSNSSKAISVYGRTPIYKVKQKNKDIINILVLGTDSRDVVQDRGRSDTMIIVSYNKKTGVIKMVSLLRDMLVPIEGYDWNRINTAYFFDGVGLTINTVNQLFGLDIQHFVVIDFNGAKDFIDYIGGISLTLSEAEAKFVGVPYSTEPIQLDGAKALIHMRNRAIGNDFGRTERQREVIVAVFRKILSENSLPELLDITQYALKMVRTNIPATTLTSLVASVAGNAGNLSIKLQSVPYEDAYQFAWYNQMDILAFDIRSTAERMLDFLYQ